jgi:hypothetical protein
MILNRLCSIQLIKCSERSRIPFLNVEKIERFLRDGAVFSENLFLKFV